MAVKQPWKIWWIECSRPLTTNSLPRCHHQEVIICTNVDQDHTRIIPSLVVNGITCHTLQGCHNGHGGISNHQPHDCLLNCLFRCRSKKTSKLQVTGLCAGNSPVTGEFPAQKASKAQKASNAENVSIWWCHHERYTPYNSLIWSLSNKCFHWSKCCVMTLLLSWSRQKWVNVLLIADMYKMHFEVLSYMGHFLKEEIFAFIKKSSLFPSP